MEDVEAARKDPLVAEHYRDIGIVRSAVLKADEWDYVNFIAVSPAPESGYYLTAKDGAYVWVRVVWTSRPLLIHAGELILEDRAGNRIRARCGNLLSETPREPKAFVIPPDMEHETPTVTMPDDAPVLPVALGRLGLLPLPPMVAFLPPADELPVSPRGPWLPSLIPVPGSPSLIPPIVAAGAIPPAVFLGGPPVIVRPVRVGASPELETLWLCFAALALIVAWIKI
jgi:hypothetical protein